MTRSRIFFFIVFCLSFSVSCSSSNEESKVKKVTIENIVLPDHPRLLFPKSEEKALFTLIKKDEIAGGLSDLLRKQADALLATEQIPFSKMQLSTSREYVYRLFTLSLAFRIYGDKKYADKVNEILLWVCSYPNWNQSHYLDTAEMTTAVAIAYDWLFDVLPQSAKDMVKKSIRDQALLPVSDEYDKGNSESWAKRETNWNVVCNSGMVLGALAVAEDYPVLTAKIIANAPKYMPNCLKHFAPDGVCYEGPGYWGYTNIYLAMYIKVMDDLFGNDKGISSMSGIGKTASYYVHSLSPSGKIFNFADAGNYHADLQALPCLLLFGEKYNQADVTTWCRAQLKEIIRTGSAPRWHFFLSLPWLGKAVAETSYDYPLLETYHGINDILVFNGKRNISKSLFLIAKGADPDMAHQQLDGGTFIIESEGIRWTEDLGSDNYSLPGFWDYRPDGQRWNYFLNTNLSHNTINIDGKIQYSGGTAHLVEEQKNSSQPYACLDMSSLYKNQATKVIRRFQLLNDATMEIQDEVSLNDSSSQLYWQVLTKATVTLSGSVAQLSMNGKSIYFKIKEPVNAVFSVKPALSNSDGEKQLSGITILQCHVNPNTVDNRITIRVSSDRNNL